MLLVLKDNINLLSIDDKAFEKFNIVRADINAHFSISIGSDYIKLFKGFIVNR